MAYIFLPWEGAAHIGTIFAQSVPHGHIFSIIFLAMGFYFFFSMVNDTATYLLQIVTEFL